MRWPDNRLCDLLGLDHPIIQAPMAGSTTIAMASAASNAGALGSLGMAMHSPEKVLEDAKSFAAQTNRSVNFNFFAHEETKVDTAKVETAKTLLQPWYDKFDAGEVPDAKPESPAPFGEALCDAVVASAPKVVSFHFGLPELHLVQRVKDAGIIVMCSATSAAEARWLEDHGVDAIIAQGFEAGGHSGRFLMDGPEQVAGTMALVPRVVDAVSIPVIAAGGIADGRGIAAALMLGAAGVQIGTAFLSTPESGVSAPHRQALLDATGDDTMYSKAFSGRPARTVANDYSREFATYDEWPQFPIGNSLTGKLRAAAIKAGKADVLSLYSGQGVGLNRVMPTAELIETLVAETQTALERIK